MAKNIIEIGIGNELKMKFEAITTKEGDKGFTSLFDGSRVKKNSPAIVFLGLVDSLNATIGIVRSSIDLTKRDNSILSRIQNDLYLIMSRIVSYETDIPYKRVLFLEKLQKRIMKKCHIPTKFINFGDNHISAYLNVLRTQIRTVEVSYHTLMETPQPVISQYLNRLSDFIYVMSLLYQQNM